MLKRKGGHFAQAVVQNFAGGNFNDLQRIISPGAAKAQCGFGELANAFGAVNRQRLCVSRHRTAAQQTGQTEKVIAMQMADENAIELTWVERGVEHLVLSAFTAVE